MNRKIRSERIMLVMAFAMMVLVTGCKENVIQPLPEVNFQTQELEVDPEGGSYSVGYTVENPSTDGVLQLSKDVDWITDLTSTDVLVSFNVSSNLSFDEDREGNVVISYLGVSDTLRVIQPKSEVDAENMKIDITVNSVTEISINATFKPSNPDSTYCIMSVTKADFAEFSDDLAFINSHVETFTKDAGEYGLSLEEYLTDYILKSGEMSRDMTGLMPDTEYYVLAFQLSPQGVPGTRLFKAEAKTDEAGSVDVSVSFDLSAEVVGSVAKLSVIPSDESVRYYWSYLAQDYLDYLQMDLKGCIEYTIEEEIYYATEAGISLSDAVESISSWGPASYEAELYSTNTHYLYAVAIDELGNLVSDVYSITFAKEAITSDNQLTLTVEEVGVDNAIVKVATTTSDPYILGVAKSTDWSGFTDEEIAASLVYGGGETYSGDQSLSFVYLTPGTDYVVAAVGYQEDTYTTEVVKAFFTTQSVGDMEDMEFKFTVENITPFGADIAIEATPETNLYYWYYKEAWMTEEDVKEDIDMIIQTYISTGMCASRLQYFKITGSRGNVSETLTSMSPDTEYKLIAVGIDETNGNYATPVFFSDPFRTSSLEEVDIIAESYISEYFDADELVAAGYDNYAGYAGSAIANLSATVSGSVECKNLYFHMASADLTDASTYPDTQILDILFDYGFHNVDKVQVFVPFDKECTLMAVGLDENGNPGKVFRKKVVLTRDGASDVDSFEPIFNSKPASETTADLKAMPGKATLVQAL